jgi:hypothetical protein
MSDYEDNARARGRDVADDSQERGRRIMSEEVTDRGLLDLSGISLDTPLEESALTRALSRVLAISEDGPSNSFQASI